MSAQSQLADAEPPSAAMDTSPSTHDISPGFGQPNGSPSHPDPSSAPLPTTLDPTASMHVALSSAPLDMDPLNSATPVRAPAPGFLPDFPPQPGAGAFSMRVDLDARLAAVHSPPSNNATPASSNPSHAASPAIHGLTPAYSIGSSSLASALDGMGVSSSTSFGRRRSESSSASTSASPELSTGREPSFTFPPPGYDDGSGSGTKEGSPDLPCGPHLFAVGSLLQNVIHTAQSAREACSLGQSTTATIKISELKRTADLIQVLMATTQITDGPPSPQKSSPHNHFSNIVRSSNSPPVVPGMLNLGDQQLGLTHQQFTPPAQFTPPGGTVDLNAMDIQGSAGLDGPSSETRKRCASSMVTDRVNKAPKIEPQDDAPLHIPPLATNGNPPAPPPLQISQMFPASGAGSLSASTVVDPRAMPPFAQSNPPSAPSSRPPSSAGLSSFNLLQQQQAPPLAYPHLTMPPATAPPITSFESISPLSSAPPFPTPTGMRSSWSDGPTTFPTTRHHHSSSSSSLGGSSSGLNINGLGPLPPALPPFTSAGTFSSAPGPAQAGRVSASNGGSPIGRVSRSGSVTGNPFSFTFPDVSTLESYDFMQPQPTASSSSHATTSAMSAPGSPESSDDDEEYDTESPPGRKNVAHSAYGSRPTTAHGLGSRQLSTENINERPGGHGNEVPQEYRAEVDRIFFEFLNKTCSNLDATDAKGEPIHQTLMAKKMQRLDESPDFRPFKFRIQAFTNAFLEELSRQGYPEEKIPMKKIRNYLWAQPYISRFNEDGKKAKSKGNHIWNIDAKKAAEGGWHFRPFQRRLAGSPPGVAYVGLRWSWTPRIWDPWGSKPSNPIKYQSPLLPSWLSWKDDTLSGVPPPDAESCDIAVEAKFIQDGQEERLSQAFHLNIAPMSTLDSAYPSSRRPSINGDMHNPRRVQSDSIVPQVQAPPRTLLRGGPPPTINQGPPPASQDAQVMQVLTTAAQRVAQEAQSQVIASRTPNEPGPELQALAKQQHVLTLTAQAFDQEVTGQRSDGTAQHLAAAAQQVVFQAARQVAADRTAAAAIQISVGITPSHSPASQVTVNEVSVATQSAVAQAVEITGPLSSEVQVLMTASSLLEQQARVPVSSPTGLLDLSQFVPPVQPTRPHSTGTSLPARGFSMTAAGGAASIGSIPFPAQSIALPPVGLSDYISHP